RRGYDVSGMATPTMVSIENNYPTIFANPFRAAGAGNLAPLTAMQRPDVECTLLRSNKVAPATAAPATSQQPLFTSLSTNEYNNTNRNPYFRYDGIQRLGNLVTTRSNTYAVWITIGYFECEQNTNVAGAAITDAAHPDGLRLGKELGADQGNIERHRAF